MRALLNQVFGASASVASSWFRWCRSGAQWFRVNAESADAGVCLEISFSKLTKGLEIFRFALSQIECQIFGANRQVLFLDDQIFETVVALVSLRELDPTFQIIFDADQKLRRCFAGFRLR